MKIRLAAISLFAIWTASAALGQAAPLKNPLGTGAAVVDAGRAVYNQTCTGCHGMNGTEGERAPALVGERRFFRLSEDAIFNTIRNGIPGTAMPAFTTLPDDNIWRIVVFIRAMRASASEIDVPGDVQQGKVIFAGKGGCMKCHMLNGQGGTIGPDLSNVGAEITLDHLRHVLTQPGPIPTGYRPIKVVTTNGDTVTGIAKNEDAFSVQILDSHDHLHLFQTTDLRSIALGDTSLMPHDFNKSLTPEEFQNLLAMLAKQVVMEIPHRREGEGEVGR